jgi:hypothetical protein
MSGKNKYKAFYKGKTTIVEADTSYQAQLEAAKFFKAKKSYEVTVMLLEVDGKPYVHSTASFAKGGEIKVTKVSEIPNLEKLIEEGKVSYRGLGLGKLSQDFYNVAGEEGYRIKVDKKEYFITGSEFEKIARDKNGKIRIKFDAPYRKFAKGGKVSRKRYMSASEKKRKKAWMDKVGLTEEEYEWREEMNEKMKNAKGDEYKKLLEEYKNSSAHKKIQGKLHSDKKMEKGGKVSRKRYATGGIYSSDSMYILTVSKDGKELGKERFRAKNKKEAKEIGEEYEEKYIKKFGDFLHFNVKEATSSDTMMAKGGQIDEYRIVPYKRLEVKGSPDLVEPYYSLAFTVTGSLTEANDKAQKFVITNDLVSATVTKIHPSGRALKNKTVSYVTKDEIQKYEDGGMMSKGGQTKKFLVDDVVYNKRTKTIGIVRLEDERGETKTDADGNVNTTELQHYNPMKYPKQKDAKVAPSTAKEIEERGLFQPFKKREKGGEITRKRYATGGVTFGTFGKGRLSKNAWLAANYIGDSKVTLGELAEYLNRQTDETFDQEKIFTITRKLIATKDYEIDDNKEWKKSSIYFKKKRYATGGEVTGEFKPARYAKDKIAYFPPDSTGLFKNREMRLAQAKGVSGKYSHREKAYIMSKGQAETLKRYLREGMDASPITGELEEKDLSYLVGSHIHIYSLGVEEPTVATISNIRVTDKKFSNRDVILATKNGGVEKFPFKKLDDFLKGEHIKITDGKEPYVIKLVKDKMAKGGEIRSKEVIAKIVKEKKDYVQNLTPKQIADEWNKHAINKISVEEASKPHMKVYLKDLLVEKELSEEEYSEYFAKGGKVKPRVRFRDKVDAIADRLEGRKVPARLKKDYGGRYNREEAEEAGRRIAGAQLAKSKESKTGRKRF